MCILILKCSELKIDYAGCAITGFPVFKFFIECIYLKINNNLKLSQSCEKFYDIKNYVYIIYIKDLKV